MTPHGQDLRAALMEAVQNCAASAPDVESGVVTKVIVCLEVVLPEQAAAFAVITNNAGGLDLHSWEALGLLTKAIKEFDST